MAPMAFVWYSILTRITAKDDFMTKTGAVIHGPRHYYCSPSNRVSGALQLSINFS